LSLTPALIGSEPGLQVVVPGAAARHARVVERDGAFVLQDGGSALGTFLAGEPVAESVLRDGDVIELGPGGPQLRFQDEREKPAAQSRGPGLTIPPVWRAGLGSARSSRSLRLALGGLLAVSVGFLGWTYRESRRLKSEMARLSATVRTAEEERRAFQLRVEEERYRFKKERRIEWLDTTAVRGAKYRYRVTAKTLDGYRSPSAGPVVVQFGAPTSP